MAPIERAATELVAEQRRLFRQLTDMGVDSYGYLLENTIGLPGQSKVLTASIRVRYCVGAEKCRPPDSEALLSLREDDGKLLITRYQPRGDLLRPWEVSDLRVENGRRVVVAASPRYADRLATVRREADRIAAYADRFGPQDGSMGKRLIFLGVPGTSAERWYLGSLEKTDFAVSFKPEDFDEPRLAAVEHVIRADQVGAGGLRDVLSWHLGYGAAHTATTSPGYEHWVLREGIATYVGEQRRNPADHVIEKDLRLVLKGWKGDLSDFGLGSGAFRAFQTGAWVVVHRLIDRYGEKKFIAFFNAVARQGDSYEAAAEEHLGRDLEKVQKDVLRHMRSLA
ncbi:MAG: hypothetical protein ACRDUA_01165 [Micromonosporaceae bacterium]